MLRALNQSKANTKGIPAVIYTVFKPFLSDLTKHSRIMRFYRTLMSITVTLVWTNWWNSQLFHNLAFMFPQVCRPQNFDHVHSVCLLKHSTIIINFNVTTNCSIPAQAITIAEMVRWNISKPLSPALWLLTLLITILLAYYEVYSSLPNLTTSSFP